MKRNIVGWFEIPVTDIARAKKFYEGILSVTLTLNDLGLLKMALFPSEEGPGASGSLVQFEQVYKPSHDGVLIYFTSPSGDLANEEERIPGFGGKVLIPKRLISEEMGYMDLFEDTEGNRIALHSNK